jgi:hypothetical protein
MIERIKRFFDYIKRAILGSEHPDSDSNLYASLTKTIVYQRWMIVFFVALLFFAIERETPIIRIGQDGSSVVRDYKSTQRVDENDIRIFVETFARNFNIVDRYRFEDSIPVALNMMSPELMKEYKSRLLNAEFIKNLKKINKKTTTKITTPKFDKDADPILVDCIVKRKITDMDTGSVENAVFRMHLVISRVASKKRMRYHYGLMVNKVQMLKEF